MALPRVDRKGASLPHLWRLNRLKAFAADRNRLRALLGCLALLCATNCSSSTSQDEDDANRNGNQSPPVNPRPRETPTPFPDIVQTVYQQINAYRRAHGLGALLLNPQINEVARQHSQNMAAGKVPFGHSGFAGRAEVLQQRLSYQAIAENVGYNLGSTNPGSEAVQGWLQSPGHLRNIVGDYRLTGIGVAKKATGEYYLTQIFVKP